MDNVNVYAGLEKITAHWDPHRVATVNDHDIKIAKIKGEFIWHHHENTDELFWVLKGTLKIEMPDETRVLRQGDVFVVPKGLEHRPVAEEETHILMIEKKGTLNTGNQVNERTRTRLKTL